MNNSNFKNNPYWIFLCIICLYSCAEECTDNLTAENKKIPYKSNDVVIFENDTSGIIADTISVSLGDVSQSYYSKNGNSDDCVGWSILLYSNSFYIHILQDNNGSNNNISFKVGQGELWIVPQNPTMYNVFDIYPNNEELDYWYKNKLIKVQHMYYPTDTFGSPIWEESHQTDSTFVYNDYIYMTDPEIKLLQYTTVYRDGTRRVWKLKE